MYGLIWKLIKLSLLSPLPRGSRLGGALERIKVRGFGVLNRLKRKPSLRARSTRAQHSSSTPPTSPQP